MSKIIEKRTINSGGHIYITEFVIKGDTSLKSICWDDEHFAGYNCLFEEVMGSENTIWVAENAKELESFIGTELTEKIITQLKERSE